MASRHGMGYLPDVPKLADYTYEHPNVVPLLQKTRRGPRPAGGGATATAAGKQDLRDHFSPVEDQGQLGSCTANAAVALVEYFQRRAKGTYVDASRLFVYKVTRNLLGWVGDKGGYLRTAMEALVLFGAPPERYWPYDGGPAESNSRFDLEPSAFCYAFGEHYRAIKYFRLDPNGAPPAQVLASVKQFLDGAFPSMFGFPVYGEYEEPLPGGLVRFPTPQSHYLGGHANVAAGYDDSLMIEGERGALLVRNSWGRTWGDQGYAWLPYRYVTEGLAVDWWTMVSADWVDTGAF